jgi:hypothetical protein
MNRGLGLKQSAQFALDEFRNLLGVQPGQYKTFGEFNKHVIKPALDEVNALATFSLSLALARAASGGVKCGLLALPRQSPRAMRLVKGEM